MSLRRCGSALERSPKIAESVVNQQAQEAA